MLSPAEKAAYDGDSRQKLWVAKHLAGDAPLVGITAKSLGPAMFCTREGNVSVISTMEQPAYAPLTDYEYLVYCLIVQGLTIHLRDDPAMKRTFDEGKASTGDLLEFCQNPETLKSTILTAQLSPKLEALLLNRFGPGYVSACKKLLTLEWMRTGRVGANLKRVFNVTFEAAASK